MRKDVHTAVVVRFVGWTSQIRPLIDSSCASLHGPQLSTRAWRAWPKAIESLWG